MAPKKPWHAKLAAWLPEAVREVLWYIWIVLAMGIIRFITSASHIEEDKAHFLASLHFYLSCLLLSYLSISAILRRIRRDFFAN